MKRCGATAKMVIVVFFILLPCIRNASAAQEAETERLIRQEIAPVTMIPEERKDQWYADAYYDPADVLQGTRTGRWNELTTRFGYIHQKIHGYLSISQLERFDDRDYTANLGGYLNMKDCYVHGEIGFGWKVSYIYNIISIAEYAHRLHENLYGQIGYIYRGYDTGDVHLVYPGLAYYFGDNYIGLDYTASYAEGRDTAHLGTIKGSFVITKFLRWGGGFAFGGRLYDINDIDAKDSFGYVLFTSLKLDIYKGISASLGYSYGTEEQKFIKRGVNCSLTVKF